MELAMQRHEDSLKKMHDRNEINLKETKDFYDFHDMAMAKQKTFRRQ